jgi:hypothetical protein
MRVVTDSVLIDLLTSISAGEMLRLTSSLNKSGFNCKVVDFAWPIMHVHTKGYVSLAMAVRMCSSDVSVLGKTYSWEYKDNNLIVGVVVDSLERKIPNPPDELRSERDPQRAAPKLVKNAGQRNKLSRRDRSRLPLRTTGAGGNAIESSGTLP